MKKFILLTIALVLLMALMTQSVSYADYNCGHNNWKFDYGWSTCTRNSSSPTYCNLTVVKVYKCGSCTRGSKSGGSEFTKDHKRGSSGCNYA